MPAISPRLGEFLVKATKARDIDDAFTRIFSEYLSMKIMKLVSISEGFKKKWCMDFEEFKDSLKGDSIKEGGYDFETEQDFWEWEEAETLKNHYEAFQKALDAVESLPFDEREEVVEIIRMRLAEDRREEIAVNAREAVKAVKEKRVKYGSIEDLKRDLLGR